MGALKRSQCGSVEIDPTNDHVVLQAHPSWQDYSKKPKDIYVQITPPKAGGTPAKSFISHNLPEHMSLISIDC